MTRPPDRRTETGTEPLEKRAMPTRAALCGRERAAGKAPRERAQKPRFVVGLIFEARRVGEHGEAADGRIDFDLFIRRFHYDAGAPRLGHANLRVCLDAGQAGEPFAGGDLRFGEELELAFRGRGKAFARYGHAAFAAESLAPAGRFQRSGNRKNGIAGGRSGGDSRFDSIFTLMHYDIDIHDRDSPAWRYTIPAN